MAWSKPHNRAIEPEKIVGVKMAPEKFEKSMQLLPDKGSAYYV